MHDPAELEKAVANMRKARRFSQTKHACWCAIMDTFCDAYKHNFDSLDADQIAEIADGYANKLAVQVQAINQPGDQKP